MLTELILITALRFHQPHDGRFTFLNACSAKGTMMFISVSQMPRGILMISNVQAARRQTLNLNDKAE